MNCIEDGAGKDMLSTLRKGKAMAKEEYTLDEAAEEISKAVPGVPVTRNRVYNWTVVRQLAEYREFPRSPGSNRKQYRVTAKGLEKLISLTRDWLEQVEGAEKGTGKDE